MFDPVIIRFEADPFILPLILTLMGQLHFRVSWAFFLAAQLGLPVACNEIMGQGQKVYVHIRNAELTTCPTNRKL